MGGLVIETIRPGVQFTPDAAAAFRRAEAQVLREFGRLIDVNSTYRSWATQLRMHLAWLAYVASGYLASLYPGHSKAVHPSESFHVSGLALDSDDWVVARIVQILAENGFIRNRLYVKGENHHFEYIRSRDQNYGKPIPAGTTEPAEPEEEDEDMDYKPTVHARTDGKNDTEWMLGHPDIGKELPVFTGEATDKNSRLSADKSVKTFRGFMVTVNRDIFTAWARTHAKGTAQITSRTDRDGYVQIQMELSRIAGELS